MSSPPATPVTPVPASTILLLRDGTEGLEVMMIERHGESGFAAGAVVFPGGKVDPTDRQLCEHCAAGKADEETLFRVAAIREAFEECAILLARRPGSDALLTAEDLHRFRAHQEEAGSFLGAVIASGAVLAADLLVPIAHWITPPQSPKRFDTHFFVAPVVSNQIAAHDGFEAVDAVWITPARAVAEAEAGTLYVMPPTYLILRQLRACGSVAAAVDFARAHKVVTVLPKIEMTSIGKVVRVPPEAGYDLEGIPLERFNIR